MNEVHRQDLVKLIDKGFYQIFFKELYEEACNLKCDWLEQKINAVQQFACVDDVTLKPSTDAVFKFVEKQIVMTKRLNKSRSKP